ncbi:hypothetical protein [Dyadobacter aurulentus]|uniref:hypothetical protein n=1 Tax=Dyadobacter sp. UC 10 TaxID=2605428 RepID=UPI0011F2065C|nr:hypothetical protein [Dyadobacter sp. UC 10]KAA0992957.1 hypothetical protein FXO21_23705 [Dyadobacter sp. UC 10]
MENNLEQATPQINSEAEELISPTKFIVLSIASFGIYPIWWSYKAWRFFRETEDADVIPAARAIFNWIFLSSLLIRIKYFAGRSGIEATFNPGVLHFVYFILIFTGRLSEPYFLISVLNFLVFLEPVTAFNSAAINSPEIATRQTSSFNTRQWVIIVVGSIWWFLIIIGLLFGEEAVA